MDRQLIKRLGFLVNHIYRFIKALVISILAEKGIDLTYEQSGLIIAMWHHEGSNQQGIADHLLKEKSSTLRLLDSLEEKGIVRREKDPHDRRNKLIFLTDSGKEILDKLLELNDENIQKIFFGLDNSNLEELEKIMGMMYNNIKPEHSTNYESINFMRLYNECIS